MATTDSLAETTTGAVQKSPEDTPKATEKSPVSPEVSELVKKIEADKKDASKSPDDTLKDVANEHIVLPPTPLPKEYSLKAAIGDFREQITSGQFTSEYLSKFVDEHVNTVRINGVDVVIIDQEWDEQNWKGEEELDQNGYPKVKPIIDPVLQAYIGADRTKVVSAEYFDPDLQQHVPNNALLEKILGLEDAYIYLKEKSQSIKYGTELGKYAKSGNKVVAVADIANSPSFVGYKAIEGLSPILGLLASKVLKLPVPSDLEYLLVGLSAYQILKYGQAMTGKGMFDKQKISEMEKFLLDTEDARRLFVAEGLKQLTEEYKPPLKDDGSETSPNQIVVVYPIAHARRISEYLTRADRASVTSRDIKKKLYRVLPNLDFSVRTWEWKDTLSKLSGNKMSAHWVKTSDRAIKI